jgi:hydrogenase maturation factor HypF (carbamoyltransferase family)
MRKAEPLKLAQISVRGVVQGVGFRPAVFHLARKPRLSGRSWRIIRGT